MAFACVYIYLPGVIYRVEVDSWVEIVGGWLFIYRACVNVDDGQFA